MAGADYGSGDDDSDRTPHHSNSGVSIAYPEGGRQPVLSNVTNLFHLGAMSVGAFAERVLGDDSSSVGGNEGCSADDDDNGKDRRVPCYCLPCLSPGRGERGRSNVRAASAIFFPLFLFSFFLLDDLGHSMMRNMRLRHVIAKHLMGSKKMIHPVLRRKTVNEYKAIRREVLWVPLEVSMDVLGHTSVDAKMKCPNGVIAMFHGCARYAASFFYSPQGRKMVSMAMERGVAIVAFEKSNEKGCWDWEQDGEAILKIGKKFLSSRLLSACSTDDEGETAYPPVWAFGASSGGSFVAALASKMEENRELWAPFVFSAVNVQIMSPPESMDWMAPTVFTVMKNDERTLERVNDRVSKKFQGGPFRMITTSGQKNIGPDHFLGVFPDDKQMTPELSKEIYQDLVTMGIVDPAKGNRLTADPRQSVEAVTSIWEKYGVEARAEAAMAVAVAEGKGGNKAAEDVLPFGVTPQMLRPLRSDEVMDANGLWLIEELNVAWDQHEITAERFKEVLDFFFEYGAAQ